MRNSRIIRFLARPLKSIKNKIKYELGDKDYAIKNRTRQRKKLREGRGIWR